MTPEQEKVHFDTFGYVLKRRLFDPGEMARFSRWFDEGCDAMCGPFTGQGQMAYPGLGTHAGLCDHYLDDPRIMDRLENLMCPEFLMMASDAQRHGGNSAWHQDSVIPQEEGRDSEYLVLKVIMYLDDLSSGQGCLWLVPGSHHRAYATSLRPLMGEPGPEAMTPSGVTPMAFPGAFATKTRPGDIIFFNQKMAHSSWGGRPGRRFLGMTFGGKPTEDWHVDWLVSHGEAWKTPCMNETKTQFPEHMVKTAGPRRKQLMDFLLSRGY